MNPIEQAVLCVLAALFVLFCVVLELVLGTVVATTLIGVALVAGGVSFFTRKE